ncbi:hypothetical protein, partial [Nonomuraea guangzhouensis]
TTDHLHQALTITREINGVGDDGLLEEAHFVPVHGREAVISALRLHTRLQLAPARALPEP